MQILRDIFKVAGEEFRMVPNIYMIRSDDKLIAVDCGTDENDWRIVEENLTYWGIHELPVTHVLITHAHGDHAGYAAELQRRGAKIICGRNADAVEHSKDCRNFYYAYPFYSFDACKPDVYVQDGDVLDINGLSFVCYETPGHSDGDIVYEVTMYGKKILFVGDVIHIEPYGSSAKIGEEWFIDSDYDAYMRSLFRMKDMEADVILSGHMQGCLRQGSEILKSAFVLAQEKFDGRWDKRKFMEEYKAKRIASAVEEA